MAEPCNSFSDASATATAAPLDALAVEAWRLEPVQPSDRKWLLRDEAASLVDGLLARVARGRAALDVAMGEGLAALGQGDRTMQLGYQSLGDYARERLGIAGRTAQAMARLARELRARPLLAKAVRSGEVSIRRAQAVLPLAWGEAEEAWVARARVETVRALEAAVRASVGAGAAEEEEEDWERIGVALSPEGRAALDEAMALAGQLLGAATPKWQRLEAICQEFLGEHPVDCDEEEASPGPVMGEPVQEWLQAAKAAMEEETERWAALEKLDGVPAPPDPTDCPSTPPALSAGGVSAGAEGLRANGMCDAFGLDEALRRLSAMRDRWDELVGHLGMIVRGSGLWREMGFASFGHYATERLGMAARTLEQRVSLERRLHSLPALRAAMREGRVSYEKARLVARCADAASADRWIEKAEKATCIALKREIEAREEAQMCARRELGLRVPRRVVLLLVAANRAARESAGHWIPAGECLELVARHFIETWKDALSERSSAQKKVLVRDRHLCQVPGCSRAANHVHHVTYRSRGGGDEGENLVAVCAGHHLIGIHNGYIHVSGRAPDQLVWELGVRAGKEPLVVFGG